MENIENNNIPIFKYYLIFYLGKCLVVCNQLGQSSRLVVAIFHARTFLKDHLPSTKIKLTINLYIHSTSVVNSSRSLKLICNSF